MMRMKERFRLRGEHEEVLNDLKDVAISYMPFSGFLDAAKFINKWLFGGKVTHRIGKRIRRMYRSP